MQSSSNFSHSLPLSYYFPPLKDVVKRSFTYGISSLLIRRVDVVSLSTSVFNATLVSFAQENFANSSLQKKIIITVISLAASALIIVAAGTPLLNRIIPTVTCNEMIQLVFFNALGEMGLHYYHLKNDSLNLFLLTAKITAHGENPLIDTNGNLTTVATQTLQFIKRLPCYRGGSYVGEEIICAYQTFKNGASFKIDMPREGHGTHLPVFKNAKEFLVHVTNPSNNNVFFLIINSYKAKGTYEGNLTTRGYSQSDLDKHKKLIGETLERLAKEIKKQLS